MRASESSRAIPSYYGRAPPHVAIRRDLLIEDHPTFFALATMPGRRSLLWETVATAIL